MTVTPKPKMWTPKSFKSSIRTRAQNAAKERDLSAGELIDLYYHRRLLARVFHADPDGWVLKGGQALLARWPAARYSTDIDLLSRQSTTTDQAVEALIAVAGTELDDHMSFRHRGTTEQTHVERPTRTVRFAAMFGNVELSRTLHVDVVVVDHVPHGDIESGRLEAPFGTDCQTWPELRMFPIVDHLAEKICAMYERYRSTGATSNRYKDLVDLVLIALKSPIDGALMHGTLRAEVQRRRARQMVIELPSAFAVPGSDWTDGYFRAARGVGELPKEFHTLDGMWQLGEAFLTPLFEGKAPSGSWNPTSQQWA